MKQFILTKDDLTLEEMVKKQKNKNVKLVSGWDNNKYYVKLTIGKKHNELTDSRIRYYKYMG